LLHLVSGVDRHVSGGFALAIAQALILLMFLQLHFTVNCVLHLHRTGTPMVHLCMYKVCHTQLELEMSLFLTLICSVGACHMGFCVTGFSVFLADGCPAERTASLTLLTQHTLRRTVLPFQSTGTGY
jgi:hypothetical protein